MREGRPSRGYENTGRPAEQDDRGDREDEPERDAAGAHALHGYREALGERHARHQEEELCEVGGRRRCVDVPEERQADGTGARDDYGGDHGQHPGRDRSGRRHPRAYLAFDRPAVVRRRLGTAACCSPATESSPTRFRAGVYQP